MKTRTKKQRSFVLIHVCADFASVYVSVMLAYWIRFSTFIPFSGHPPSLLFYAKLLVVIIPVFLLSFRTYGLYQTTRRNIRRIEEIFRVIRACSLAAIVLMSLSFFYRGETYSRIYLGVLWICSMTLVSVTRYLLIQMEYRRKRKRREVTKVLIAGANRNARHIIRWANSAPHYGVEISGVLSNDPALVGTHLEKVSILGSTEQAEAIMSGLQPDELMIVDKQISRERITQLVNFCEEKLIDIKVGTDYYGLMTHNLDVEYTSTVPLLGFRPLPLDDSWNRFIKRAFDIFVSMSFLMVSLPLWIVIAMAIKLEDRGPLFYRQERLGRDHKVFDVLKFRTMKVNAEAESGPVWARAGDDRKTRTGNFLRSWNLDELPQLLNVLRGDMSMVGPRPERQHFINQFREDIPRYMARHKIQSGLTGWAAVNGYRGNTSITERTKYDLYYMENWSVLFDIEIILMTFFAFKNAY